MAKPKTTKEDIASYLDLDKDSVPATLREAHEVASDLYLNQNERDRLIVKKNEAIREASEKFDKQIERYQSLIDRCVKRLKLFCLRFRADFFDEKKSMTCAGVKLAFRLSPGKVVTLSGKKEADIVEELLASTDRTQASRYLAFKPSLDKKEILAAWDEGEERQAQLRAIGVEVIQPEEFSAEPEFKQETANRETA